MLNNKEPIFNEENHTYELNGKKLISVTQLLKKHNIAPDYSGVNEKILQAKAERGKLIHKELEEYVKNGKIGFTNEFTEFTDLCEKENIQPKKSEFIVWNDIVAGTVDTYGKIGNDYYMGDFKTTSVFHKKSVAWQLSLYAYLAGIIVNKLICFHFTKNGLKMIEVQPIPLSQIEKLLKCEREGTIYNEQKNEITIKEAGELAALQNVLNELDSRKKEIEERQEKLKQFILEKMEELNIDSIDNDFFTITYYAPSVSNRFDSKTLQKEMPEIYDKFIKKTNVKSYIKIKIKGE